MTNFNKWLSQRDRKVYREMFSGPLNLPVEQEISRKGIVIADKQGHISLTSAGKNYLTGKFDNSTLMQKLNNIGSAIENMYLAPMNTGMSDFEEVNLGQLENEIRDIISKGPQRIDNMRDFDAFKKGMRMLAQKRRLDAKETGIGIVIGIKK